MRARRRLIVVVLFVTACRAPASYDGVGDVVEIDAARQHVTLRHDGLRGLSAAGTVRVAVRSPELLADLGPGLRVRFTVQRQGDGLVVTRITRIATARTPRNPREVGLVPGLLRHQGRPRAAEFRGDGRVHAERIRLRTGHGSEAELALRAVAEDRSGSASVRSGVARTAAADVLASRPLLPRPATGKVTKGPR